MGLDQGVSVFAIHIEYGGVHPKAKEYNVLQTKLGLRVLSRQSALDKELEELERQHYQEHSKLPSKQDNSTL